MTGLKKPGWHALHPGFVGDGLLFAPFPAFLMNTQPAFIESAPLSLVRLSFFGDSLQDVVEPSFAGLDRRVINCHDIFFQLLKSGHNFHVIFLDFPDPGVGTWLASQNHAGIIAWREFCRCSHQLVNDELLVLTFIANFVGRRDRISRVVCIWHGLCWWLSRCDRGHTVHLLRRWYYSWHRFFWS